MASELTLPLVANDVAATDAGDISWQGGRGLFIAEATVWGGGSVTLQYKSPQGTYINVDAISGVLSANGMVMFELPPGSLKAVRAVATGVYAWAIGTRVD